MALYFRRQEDGWTDVTDMPDWAGTSEEWTRVQPHQDDALLAQLASPVPMKRWRAVLVYMHGSRGYRIVRREVEGVAANRTEVMEQIQARYQDKRGFYIAEIHEVAEPVTIQEESCRATVTI